MFRLFFDEFRFQVLSRLMLFPCILPPILLYKKAKRRIPFIEDSSLCFFSKLFIISLSIIPILLIHESI